MDSQTIRDLEIFINYESKKSNRNTFIDNFRCLTDGGTRLLRANLLQPITNTQQIGARTKLLTQILGNKSLQESLSK